MCKHLVNQAQFLRSAHPACHHLNQVFVLPSGQQYQLCTNSCFDMCAKNSKRPMMMPMPVAADLSMASFVSAVHRNSQLFNDKMQCQHCSISFIWRVEFPSKLFGRSLHQHRIAKCSGTENVTTSQANYQLPNFVNSSNSLNMSNCWLCKECQYTSRMVPYHCASLS